jgi:hypothetical protein
MDARDGDEVRQLVARPERLARDVRRVEEALSRHVPVG